jgi:hypothetical protein
MPDEFGGKAGLPGALYRKQNLCPASWIGDEDTIWNK